MPILTKEVEVRPSGKMIQYYRDLGYDVKCRQPLMVKVEDLPKRSDIRIEVMCDMCKENIMTIKYSDYNKSIENTGNRVCEKCIRNKADKTNQKKYGTPYPIQNESFKEKRRQTCLERYGVDNYTQTEECREKMKQTCMEKYGVEYATQSKKIKNKTKQTNLKRYGVDCYAKTEECQQKMKQTNLNRYGVEYPFQSDIVKEKWKQTNLERYGVEHNMQLKEVLEKRKNTYFERYGFDSAMKHPDVKAKVVKTMHENGTQKTSKQQLYLHGLYGGELNYPIKYYDVDICFPEEKICIEYDGGGHNLSVVFGDFTQEEFDQREIIRFHVIKREGYRQIKIISAKDKLPNDDILFQMLSDAKQYFSTTNHSWVHYDIDNSIMINVENKDMGGAFYDYGKLRTVKKHVA